ncbi:MAG: aminoacyl-tRNA hydrolase [Holosporales bacterium]|nr:aminoacyl-tRNA hydrolase [Holosporales bacterium]
MFLVVGLGNPGLAYLYTRHNVGFMFADCLVRELGSPDFKAKGCALRSEKAIDGVKVIILKPQTFMNLSGRAVAEVVSFYKIQTSDVFVIHDDIDLSPCEVRIKFAGGHGGHNGLRDIDRCIGKNYWRIRIGVGRPPAKDLVADYVLSPFYNDELTRIVQTIHIIAGRFTELLLANDKAPIINDIMKAGEAK